MDINITLVVPDAQVSRVQDALRIHWGQIEDPPGTYRDLTNAELIDNLKDSLKRSVKGIVLRVEQEAAAQAARDAIVEVDVT